MKKSERLNGLIFALKERGRLSAKDLANIFEVSERTIYRDIDALSQLKVPIIAYDGLGGGYEIDKSYFIPSIQLTEQEAIMLLMVLKLGDEIQFPNFKADYAVLKSKIMNVIEDKKSASVDSLLGKINFYVTDVIPRGYDQGVMVGILEAFLNVKQVAFTYYNPAKDEWIRRKVSPNDFHYDGGAWYIEGYCHLRNEKRVFRLDRMRDLEVLDLENEHFHAKLSSEFDEFKPVSYTLKIEPKLYRLIKDNFYFADSQILESSPQILVKLNTSHERTILHLVLEHPEDITLVAPESLKKKMKNTIFKLHQKYLNKP